MDRVLTEPSIKLHLPSALAAETCCGLPLDTVILGAYAGYADDRGHWRAFIFDAEDRRGYACKGCLAIYERQQLATLIRARAAA